MVPAYVHKRGCVCLSICPVRLCTLFWCVFVPTSKCVHVSISLPVCVHLSACTSILGVYVKIRVFLYTLVLCFSLFLCVVVVLSL